MGANFAHDLANTLNIEQALAIHLASNHFPPVPAYMVKPCLDAIEAYNTGNYSDLVELPEGVTWRHASRIPANVVISEFHLHAWLGDDQDY